MSGGGGFCLFGFFGGEGRGKEAKNHTMEINEVNVMIRDDQSLSVLGKV